MLFNHLLFLMQNKAKKRIPTSRGN
uniref:Uncharacterized protein n=1 Tax=Rhizophora mucronata TaxID=61149 RepID=A0A2P2JNH7_RHIMU